METSPTGAPGVPGENGGSSVFVLIYSNRDSNHLARQQEEPLRLFLFSENATSYLEKRVVLYYMNISLDHKRFLYKSSSLLLSEKHASASLRRRIASPCNVGKICE
jgi:hypothetical protein